MAILSCEEALRFLATYLDGELASTSQQEVEDHLARCRSCYSRAEFERRMKQEIAALAQGRAEVPAAFADRIQRLLGQFTATPKTPGH